MDSLKGSYERAPEGGNFIEWTEIMRQRLDKIKEALWEKCALYILNDTGDYTTHTDALDIEVGGMLEQLGSLRLVLKKARTPDPVWSRGQDVGPYGTKGMGCVRKGDIPTGLLPPEFQELDIRA